MLVLSVVERGGFVEQPRSLGVRSEVERRIASSQRLESRDQQVARSGAYRPELSHRRAWRASLVTGPLELVSEFACSDKRRVGVALGDPPTGSRWPSEAVVVDPSKPL